MNAGSRDLEDRPFTPFGGPGMVVKCDESKFNHKAKVKPSCPYFPESQKCFLLYFGRMKQIVLKSVHLFKNVKQTAATNIMIKCILLLPSLTFRTLQHTSSEVTVENKFKYDIYKIKKTFN